MHRRFASHAETGHTTVVRERLQADSRQDAQVRVASTKEAKCAAHSWQRLEVVLRKTVAPPLGRELLKAGHPRKLEVVVALVDILQAHLVI
mmetsp:Transcript_6813/g.9713  ORF Transcript_6813/g.9713 Transcript_6813/m.9713 type:complete len:91 (-) Transcript_6813:56-328(-)